jgi:hypothetical protein
VVIINTSDFCRTWNVTWSVMIAMHAGSPSNARCSFSHQCTSILYRCSANYKVYKSLYMVLSQNFLQGHFLFCFVFGVNTATKWSKLITVIRVLNLLFFLQGKECLCSILIASRTDYNGSKYSRAGRRGGYFVA